MNSVYVQYVTDPNRPRGIGVTACKQVSDAVARYRQLAGIPRLNRVVLFNPGGTRQNPGDKVGSMTFDEMVQAAAAAGISEDLVNPDAIGAMVSAIRENANEVIIYLGALNCPGINTAAAQGDEALFDYLKQCVHPFRSCGNYSLAIDSLAVDDSPSYLRASFFRAQRQVYVEAIPSSPRLLDPAWGAKFICLSQFWSGFYGQALWKPILDSLRVNSWTRQAWWPGAERVVVMLDQPIPANVPTAGVDVALPLWGELARLGAAQN